MSEFMAEWRDERGWSTIDLVVSGLAHDGAFCAASIKLEANRLVVSPSDEKDAEFNRFYDLNEAKAAALERFRARLVAFLKETGGLPVDPEIIQRIDAMQIALRNVEATFQPRDFAAEMIAEHCPQAREGNTFLNTPKVGDVRYVSSDEPLPEGWKYTAGAVVDTNPPIVPIRYYGVPETAQEAIRRIDAAVEDGSPY